MKEILSNKYLLLISRVILGYIFIYAGMVKIIDPAGFAESILNYRLTPIFLVNIFAIVIPWIEVLVGVFLIFGISSKESSFIIGSLLIIFNIMIFISVIRGLDIECGCFGTNDSQTVGIQKLLENFVLLLLSIQIILFDKNKLSLKPNAIQ